MNKYQNFSTASYLGLISALLFCHLTAHAESTTNKCTDGHEITYANTPCEKLGLKAVGPVKKKITVIPAISESDMKLSENMKKKDGGDNNHSEADDSKKRKYKPVSPLLEKLLQ